MIQRLFRTMTESFNWLGRCARAAAFGIAALLLLTIARIVFFFAYKNDDLGFLSDFAPAMVMGLRVDAKWLAILLLPAWICVLLSYWKAFFWKAGAHSCLRGHVCDGASDGHQLRLLRLLRNAHQPYHLRLPSGRHEGDRHHDHEGLARVHLPALSGGFHGSALCVHHASRSQP